MAASIVDEVYRWYVEHLEHYRLKGVHVELNPPIEYSGVRACPESFERLGNDLSIFLWDVGHLERNLYRAAAVDFNIEYHKVESGSDACVIIEGWLEEFALLPPGPSPEEARRLILSGELQIDGHDDDPYWPRS